MRKNLLMLGLLFLLAVSAQAFTLGKLGNFEFKKVYDNVYIMHGPVMNPSVENEGFMNNPALIVGKVGLIVIDPGGNYNVGKKILAEIENISKKPIVATINTHKHGDHWFANKAIMEKYPDVTRYALPHMIEVVKNGGADKWYGILDRLSHNLKGTNDEYPYPNKTVINGDKLEIDGQTFYFINPSKAHTDTDIVVIHANSKTMFMGDNVMKGRLGGFDGSSSILGNIKLLEEIEKAPELTLYVPGHGPSGKMHETLDPFLNYMKKLVKGAKKALEEDMEAYEVKPEVIEDMKDYQKWDAFDHQMGKHLQKVLGELELISDEEE
jgi:glyoxylase-like metal-dependent hydrolase (beta-lactamase superfamily II)